MFVHPSAAFPTYHRSSASPFLHRQAYSGLPTSSCGAQHYHAESQPRSSHAYYSRYGAPGAVYDTHMASDDDYDDGTGEAAAYYQYLLAAARKEQRQKDLRRQAQEQAEAEAQAERAREQERRERRAAQQLAFLEARARAVAQAEAEAEAAAEQKQEQRRLQAYAQARAEQERKAALAEQYKQYIQHRREEQERYTAEMERRRAVQAEQERHRQAAIEQQRTTQRQDSEEDLFRSIFGQWLSLPAPTTRSASPSPSPAPIPASRAHSKPAAKATDTRVPAASAHDAKVAHVGDASTAPNATAPRQDETDKVKTVHSVRSKFESLKTGFKPQDALVFDPARSTPQAPFLAYNTPANRPLQEYEEHLTRLLTELDAIASDGIEAIRAERKKLNNDVQSELNRLDELRAQAWKAQHPDAEQQQASDQQKEQEAAADDAVQDKPIAIAEEEAPAEAKVESDSVPQTIEVQEKPNTVEAVLPEALSANESTSSGMATVAALDALADAATSPGSNDNIDSSRQADVATDSHAPSSGPASVPATPPAGTAPITAVSPSADLSGASADTDDGSPSEAAASEPASPSLDGDQAISEASREHPAAANSAGIPSTSASTATPPETGPTSDAPTSKRQPDSSFPPASFMLPPALGLDLIASVVHEAAGEEHPAEAGASDVSGDSDSETSFEML